MLIIDNFYCAGRWETKDVHSTDTFVKHTVDFQIVPGRDSRWSNVCVGIVKPFNVIEDIGEQCLAYSLRHSENTLPPSWSDQEARLRPYCAFLPPDTTKRFPHTSRFMILLLVVALPCSTGGAQLLTERKFSGSKKIWKSYRIWHTISYTLARIILTKKQAKSLLTLCAPCSGETERATDSPAHCLL